jgi:protocatechuate 3,4-dioxygenase alpha subunit
VPGPDGRDQAPHIAVSVMARGILTRFITRIYFEGEAANAEDAILALVPEDRRPTLIARRAGDGRYRFDLVMQGPGETVFFDV